MNWTTYSEVTNSQCFTYTECSETGVIITYTEHLNSTVIISSEPLRKNKQPMDTDAFSNRDDNAMTSGLAFFCAYWRWTPFSTDSDWRGQLVLYDGARLFSSIIPRHFALIQGLPSQEMSGTSKIYHSFFWFSCTWTFQYQPFWYMPVYFKQEELYKDTADEKTPATYIDHYSVPRTCRRIRM